MEINLLTTSDQLTMAEWIFWTALALVFYTYVGYGMLLGFLVRMKKKFFPEKIFHFEEEELPSVTFIVAAYNEEAYIQEKIDNCLSLEYPQEKISYWFVTDGSNDGTMSIIESNPEVRLLHREERAGKIAAMHRAMGEVESDIAIFSDANALLNPEAVMEMVQCYANPQVGAVAGEKGIAMDAEEKASGAGEGIYWKYESQLKKWDYQLYSVVGAAGELFSVRTSLYEGVEPDTLLDDFMISLRIAQKGYRVAYAPNAKATEKASLNVEEEMKRKIRISAGGLQSISRLIPLLNIFKHGWLSFQYISHRVLRWTLAPLALPFIFISNGYLAVQSEEWIYSLLLLGQLGFYFLAFLGMILQDKKVRIKGFFVPYYFAMMNWSVYLGLIRLLKGRQSVKWEKAVRATTTS
ncbi:glycosyltransferase family 2 protein [Persicobacter sp. CCB-QB2]|uniref:glycosyltransferase family 2 protein n=1 Tax=Persicobacter sp. CCB-QB2 TaxID=1561025 RepID=UPI000A59DEB4|nr:glycosyltransferase family 2 protein [Persicobacter sp. CCB-QB2]